MEIGNVGIKSKVESEQRQDMGLHQRLEAKFDESFDKVFDGNKPKVTIDIFYSPHETPEDTEGLSERIRQADVYIPEIVGWSRKTLSFLRDASTGEISSEDLKKRLRRYSESFRRQLIDIHGSGKAITLIDVRSRSNLRKESQNTWEYAPSFDGDFPELLDYTKTFLRNLSSYIKRREDYMISQVSPEKVEELLERYPWLRDKKEIMILLSLGSGHAPLPPNYNNTSFMDEGIIRSKFGEEVNDELASKIFLEYFIEGLLSSQFVTVRDWLTKDSKKITRLKRVIIGQLDYKDGQRIFDYYKQMRIPPIGEFERMFHEKGITLPENERELDELLAKHKES